MARIFFRKYKSKFTAGFYPVVKLDQSNNSSDKNRNYIEFLLLGLFFIRVFVNISYI